MRFRNLRILIWILLGLALRGIALDGNGLWMDEGYTAWTAHLPAEEHEKAIRNDDAPPLYYTIQRALLPNLPANERSVRLLSAVAGVAGITWLIACPPIAGLMEAPAAFYALGTYGVFYGREARSYALLMLWSLILITATMRFLDGRRRWLVGVVLAEALALWTHNVAIHLVVAANVAWLIAGRRRPVEWIGAQFAVLLIWLPQLIRLLTEQFTIHQTLNAPLAGYWERIPLAVGPLLSLASFTSGARLGPISFPYRWFYRGPGDVLLAIAAFVCVATLLVCAYRRGQKREALSATTFTLMPLATLALASSLFIPSYTMGRTDAIAYAGFIVWAGLGFRGLPGWGRRPVIGILLLSTALAVATNFPVGGQERENDRLLAEELRDVVQPGDWIAFVGASRPSIDYYISDGRPGLPDVSIHRIQYPRIFSANPASDYPITGDSLRTWEEEALKIRAAFEADDGSRERMFYCVAPIAPGRAPESPTAEDLYYPGSILAYVFNGLQPLGPLGRRLGDQLQVEWIIFGVRRDEIVSQAELKPVIRAD